MRLELVLSHNRSTQETGQVDNLQLPTSPPLPVRSATDAFQLEVEQIQLVPWSFHIWDSRPLPQQNAIQALEQDYREWRCVRHAELAEEVGLALPPR